MRVVELRGQCVHPEIRVELGLDFIVSILTLGAHIPEIASAGGCCHSVFSTGLGCETRFLSLALSFQQAL